MQWDSHTASLCSPLTCPRLGCRHPGVRSSSESRMESKHLMALSESCGGARPGRRRGTKARLGAPLRSRHLVRTSGPTPLHRPASPCTGPRTNLSRTSWRSNTSGSYAVAPRGTDRVPCRPDIASVPTRGGFCCGHLQSGRSPAGIRGSSALGGVQPFAQLQSPPSLAHLRSHGPGEGKHEGPRLHIPSPSRSRRPCAIPAPGPTRRFRQPQPSSCSAT